MVDFDSAVSYVLDNEGGLEENPSDPGGITNFGISFRFLQAVSDPKKYGLTSETINKDTIEHLTLDQAKSIYKGEFWDRAPFQRINNQQNANFIFDMVVNMGMAPGIKCVQRSCWAVMHKRNAIPDDGILGDDTVEMINHCGFYLLPVMRSERAAFYEMNVLRNPGQKVFLNGWLNRSYGE